MNILFTSVGRRVELIAAFHAAARRLGVDLVIHGSDITETAPALFYCDRTHITARIRDPRYIPELLQICRENQIELLIPTIDTDLLLLSQNKEKFEEIGTRVLIAAPEMIGICRDKRYTADFFNECGLLSPAPVDDINLYHGGFPCFIKPKDGSSSINAFRADDEEQLRAFTREVPDYIIQPYIEGTEYTIDIFCDFDGNPIYVTPRERVLVRAGEVIKTTIFQDDDMIDESLKVIERFKPCGPITVQLIRDNDSGRDYYIEINPRFGGGCPLSMKAGADSAEAAIALLLGRKLSFMRGAAADLLEYSRFDDSVVSGGCSLVTIRDLKELLVQSEGLDAVIFDLDDTLYDEVDYVKSGYRCVAEVAAEMYGVSAADLGASLLDYYYRGFQPITRLVQEYQTDETKRSEDNDTLLEHYRLHEPEICLRQGAMEVIDALKEKGLKIGIITDGRPMGQRNKLKALGLDKDKRIDEIIITDELAGRHGNPKAFRKPAQVAFDIMQARMAVPFQKMAYVGDNMGKDFTAPRRLGMRCIYFENPVGLYQKKAGKQA